MTKVKLYQAIARTLVAIENCRKTDNHEWLAKHSDRLAWLAREYLPSGSGIDNGCQIDLDRSRPDRIVITLGFHHMNDAGFYDGWTEHECIVTPSLAFGVSLRITGRDRQGIKDFLYHDLELALTAEIDSKLLLARLVGTNGGPKQTLLIRTAPHLPLHQEDQSDE